MLEIQERFDTAGYERIIERAGDALVHITEAIDKGQSIGFIAYSYGAEETTVYDYGDSGELMLCDGLVRSVMFKSALKGIGRLVFDLEDKKKEVPLRKLRFLTEGSCVCEDIDSYMNGCQNCKSNQK